MLRPSIQTTNIIEAFGIDEGFRTIRDAGFEGVDFTLIPFVSRAAIEGKAESIFDKSDDEIIAFFRPYKEAADRYGIGFFQAHAPVQSLHKTERACRYMIEVFKKSLMVCKYLECPYLVVHPFFFFEHQDQLDSKVEWDFNISGYSQLIPSIRKYGVTVCLENMFSVYRDKPYAASCQETEETIRYIDTLNEIAGSECFAFCYDSGHANLIGRDVYTVIRKLGRRIACLHLHDNNGREDQHLAPYMGSLDWNRFIKGLREIGYRGELNFESHGIISSFDRDIVPEALRLTAAAGRMFAKRILAE